tara:strand:- start:34 stop:177 length:144 start_codon:yes stop_codon:yes gene_type:complete
MVEEIILDEMIEILNLPTIGLSILPISKIMIVFKEKFLEEITIMHPN